MNRIERPFSLWMNQVRDHPWTALLIAGAAGIVVATLWPHRTAIAAAAVARSDTSGRRLAEEMAEPIDYPGYRPVPEHFGQPLH